MDDVRGVSVECFNVLIDAVLKFQLYLASNTGNRRSQESISLWAYGAMVEKLAGKSSTDTKRSCSSLTNFCVHEL